MQKKKKADESIKVVEIILNKAPIAGKPSFAQYLLQQAEFSELQDSNPTPKTQGVQDTSTYDKCSGRSESVNRFSDIILQYINNPAVKVMEKNPMASLGKLEDENRKMDLIPLDKKTEVDFFKGTKPAKHKVKAKKEQKIFIPADLVAEEATTPSSVVEVPPPPPIPVNRWLEKAGSKLFKKKLSTVEEDMINLAIKDSLKTAVDDINRNRRRAQSVQLQEQAGAREHGKAAGKGREGREGPLRGMLDDPVGSDDLVFVDEDTAPAAPLAPSAPPTRPSPTVPLPSLATSAPQASPVPPMPPLPKRTPPTKQVEKPAPRHQAAPVPGAAGNVAPGLPPRPRDKDKEEKRSWLGRSKASEAGEARGGKERAAPWPLDPGEDADTDVFQTCDILQYDSAVAGGGTEDPLLQQILASCHLSAEDFERMKRDCQTSHYPPSPYSAVHGYSPYSGRPSLLVPPAAPAGVVPPPLSPQYAPAFDEPEAPAPHPTAHVLPHVREMFLQLSQGATAPPRPAAVSHDSQIDELNSRIKELEEQLKRCNAKETKPSDKEAGKKPGGKGPKSQEKVEMKPQCAVFVPQPRVQHKPVPAKAPDAPPGFPPDPAAVSQVPLEPTFPVPSVASVPYSPYMYPQYTPPIMPHAVPYYQMPPSLQPVSVYRYIPPQWPN